MRHQKDGRHSHHNGPGGQSTPQQRTKHGQRHGEKHANPQTYEHQKAQQQIGRSECSRGEYGKNASGQGTFDYRGPQLGESRHYPIEENFSQDYNQSADWRGDFRDQSHSGGWLPQAQSHPGDQSYPQETGLWESIKEGARDYFGIGPKDYRRSDERIREDACEALTHEPSVDASQIEVRVSKGKITLAGSVSSRWMKRRAEDCVHELPGVQDVRNELEVLRAANAAGNGSYPSAPSLLGAQERDKQKTA